jgi:hypothetical protein
MSSKKMILVAFVVAIVVGAVFLLVKKAEAPQIENQSPGISQQSTIKNNQENNLQNPLPSVDDKKAAGQIKTVNPIDNALGRITKKPFGIFITPKTSPVQPERFSGYHTAVDLETTSAEKNIDVPVKALCDGKLLSARFASGYGGVAVQSCKLDGMDATVIYGHIRLSSVKTKIGDRLNAGDFLANLGTGFSAETDGERKHLHLGIHRGTAVNILGYVQSKSALANWLDPAQFLN